MRSASLSSWTVCRFRGAGSADLKLVATNLRTLTEQLLDEGAALPIKGFQGACRNIIEHREALWRFVFELGVDPTNNHAKRELRGLVCWCWRRSTGGSRSDPPQRKRTTVRKFSKLRYPNARFLSIWTTELIASLPALVIRCFK